MSTPVAIVGLTYDGQDLQAADLSLFLRIEKGLNEQPRVRGEDTVVPGRAGRVEGLRENDVIEIELVGQVTATPGIADIDDRQADWRTRMRGVRALFATNRARAMLVATLEDGDVLEIEALPINLVVAREIRGEYASLSIELEGYDDWAPAAGS